MASRPRKLVVSSLRLDLPLALQIGAMLVSVTLSYAVSVARNDAQDRALARLETALASERAERLAQQQQIDAALRSGQRATVEQMLWLFDRSETLRRRE